MAEFLPDLPLIEIFKHLGIVDLTKARAVSRRWKALIDCSVRIEELVLCVDGISGPKWFHLNKQVDRDNVLNLDVIADDFSKFSKKIVRLHLLSSLKRLRVIRETMKRTAGRDVDRLFSRLTKFTALEHLEVHLDFSFCLGWNCALVHPNLKVLSLAYLDEHPKLHIKIDCPRLEFLECDAPFNRFTLTHPETIKYLTKYCFRNWDADHTASSSDLEAFANVERYMCNNLHSLDGVNIWSLPKLKEIRAKDLSEDFYLDNNEWMNLHLWFVRSVLTGLIAKKKRLGSARGSPKIYFNDKECSANLKESHPYLFPSEGDSTDSLMGAEWF